MNAMNAKTITRIVLLSMVAIAVGAWAMKEFGPAKAAAEGDAAATTTATRPDGVSVINFHGETRCPTCIRIGTLARQVIDEQFGAEQQAGTVHWDQLNYDEASNARFVKDYGLVSSTVVVTLWQDGREVKWKRLDAVWDHVADEPAFLAYVAREVSELLETH